MCIVVYSFSWRSFPGDLAGIVVEFAARSMLVLRINPKWINIIPYIEITPRF
jgi:hypothetical protein